MDIKRVSKKTTAGHHSRPSHKEPPRENSPRNFQKTDIPQKEKSEKGTKKLLLWKAIFAIIILSISATLLLGAFLVYRFNSFGKKINPESKKEISLVETVRELVTKDYPPLRSQDGRINILLLGIAGEGKPGQNLTDTIMVLSINTDSDRIAMLSLPRDLFVKIPGTGSESKINSIYQIGLGQEKDRVAGAELIKKTVGDVLGEDIDYYAILNFQGFEKIIDAIGGINIMNERDILDTSYPGPNYSYETFELKKGFHHLDGKTALKYARERHNDPEGDFGRAKRQQQIMQSVKNKIFSIKTLFNVFALNEMFVALEDNIRTDIQTEEIGSFLELAKKLDTQNINNVVVDAWSKDSLLKVAHVPLGGVNAFVLVPKTGNYFEIRELAKNIFDLDSIKRRKEEIQKEDARIAIIDRSGDAYLYQKIRKVLMEHMEYKNIREIFPDDRKPDQESTEYYELSPGSKPFTLDELGKVLSAKFSPDNSRLDAYGLPEDTDIVIELGKDLIEKYNVEEGTLEEWQASQEDNH